MYTDDAFNYLMFLLSGGRPVKIKPKRKMTKQIRKKIKKVAKGLSKASKTHARQAKALRSVLKTKKAKT